MRIRTSWSLLHRISEAKELKREENDRPMVERGVQRKGVSWWKERGRTEFLSHVNWLTFCQSLYFSCALILTLGLLRRIPSYGNFMEPADTSMPKRREKPSASLPRKDRTKKSKDSEKSTDDNSPLIPATQSQTVETEEGVISHHTKKRSKEEKELQEPSENTAKASKKRKRKDIENGPPTPPQSKVNENDGNIEPKRKKRNRTEFTDPRADESLGSQCRKGEHTTHNEPN